MTDTLDQPEETPPDPIIYARDLDGTGSMHICSKEDPGAMEYLAKEEMIGGVDLDSLFYDPQADGQHPDDMRVADWAENATIGDLREWIKMTISFDSIDSVYRKGWNDSFLAFHPEGTLETIEDTPSNSDTDAALVERFKGDFNALTPEELDREARKVQERVDRDTEWLEAVAAYRRLRAAKGETP